MDKERQDELEWFVQFANMDLNQLKPGDRAKLIVESEEYLFPHDTRGANWPGFEILKTKIDLNDILLDKLKLGFKRPPIDSPQYFDKILEFQETVRGELGQLLRRESKGEMEIFTVLFVKKDDPDKFIFKNVSMIGKQADFVRIRLNILFNGLPRSTLQKCPGCEKYYLNFTMRRKRFCSPKCIWKVNAEKRREEIKKHPREYKAYLKKQREIMRRKYEEKRRTELGPNVRIARSGARKD